MHMFTIRYDAYVVRTSRYSRSSEDSASSPTTAFIACTDIVRHATSRSCLVPGARTCRPVCQKQAWSEVSQRVCL